MLWATARSVRLEVSKQRFALQDFSYVRVSLVRGKSGWRIGSVESLGNPFLAAPDRQTRTFFQQLVRFLRRFLQGEEPVPTVFEDTWDLFAAQLTQSEQETLRDLYELRQLYHLGYISARPDFAPLLEESILSHRAATMPPTAQKAINSAHSVSHL